MCVIQGDVQRRIREMLAETMREESSIQAGPMGEQEMLSRLKQRGVVDNILQQIQFEGGADLHRQATHFTDKETGFKQPSGKKSKRFIKGGVPNLSTHGFPSNFARYLHKAQQL